MTVRTRFAPSPSGHLHVGGARTALFCWAYARKRGGRFILRIEDTDQKRASEAASVGFLKDLAWLGMDWDEGPRFEDNGGGEYGPYFQSERLSLYHHYIQQLINDGRAYRAFETAEELDAARAKARAEKVNYRYDRAALQLDEATIQQYLDEGKPHVVRFKVPEGDVVIEDEVLGAVTTSRSEMDDFVILKADGYPTYHFAVVVDDKLMKVTHVVRGQEHLANTPRHVLLQDALGFRRPVYGHLSIIFNPDGSKMSKRDKDKTLRRAVKERGMEAPPEDADGNAVMDEERWQWWLASKNHQLELDSAEKLAAVLDVRLPEISVDEFRRAGYLPSVMINYLALLGWSPGDDVEKFDLEFLVDRFDLDRVIKAPAKFDRAKLLAFNLDALQAMSAEAFTAAVREHGERYHPTFIGKLSDEQFAMFAASNQSRSKTLDDPFTSCLFFIQGDDEIVYESTKAVRKALCSGEPCGYDNLESLLPTLHDLESWTVSEVEGAVKSFADDRLEGKLGKVAQPLRIAVTGGTISPAIFETLVVLGRESVLNRIERCLANREAISQ